MRYDNSRYLLACHFTPSYRAVDVATALDLAREEAGRHHGPLAKTPVRVTDNGSSFLARRFRQHIDGVFRQARINYRTPTHLGLLERFLQTLKTEEIYWHISRTQPKRENVSSPSGSGTTPSDPTGRYDPTEAVTH